MAKITPELFSVLNDARAAAVLVKLYRTALKQNASLLWHFLPKAYKLLSGKGTGWKGEHERFFDDKYIPIHPAQGDFLYLQARAVNAKTIFEFGTSYGISTIYLAKAAKDNGGKVITTEYLPHKVKAARQNIADAGLEAYAEVIEGDARATLGQLSVIFDLVLLDGWPDLVFPVFKLLEPHLKKGALILTDDVGGFKPAMQDYLNYVRDPRNGYLSATLRPRKDIEFTIKTR